MGTTIGFLGTGNMGGPMAARLLDAGHAMVVRDVSAQAVAALVERGATAADSAKALGDRAEIVFCSLPNNAVMREAVLGANGLIEGGKTRIFINTCTTGTPFAIEVTDAFKARNVVTLEAPISGGPAGAAAGTLSVMASGPQAAFDEVRPLFEVLGSRIVYCGDKPGLGQVLKLANNLVYAASFMATCEVFAMGMKAGLDPKLMVDSIGAGIGRNYTIDTVMPNRVLNRKFDFGAPIEMLMKDVDLALAEGEAQGVPQFVSQQTRQLLKWAMHQGWQHRDITELAKVIEEWSGVEFKA